MVRIETDKYENAYPCILAKKRIFVVVYYSILNFRRTSSDTKLSSGEYTTDVFHLCLRSTRDSFDNNPFGQDFSP